MTEAIERSMLPRPVVTTNIWPRPTIDKKDADNRIPDRLATLNRLVTAESAPQKIITASADQIHRWECAHSKYL